MKIHEKIRFMRQSKNWSQDEMAEKLDMSVSGYAKIEQGKSEATFAKLEEIADIFEMDAVELLTLGEKNVLCLIGENSMGSNTQIMGASKELAFEIEKLQLIVEHQKNTLAQKDKEIARLESLFEWIKTQN